MTLAVVALKVILRFILGFQNQAGDPNPLTSSSVWGRGERELLRSRVEVELGGRWAGWQKAVPGSPGPPPGGVQSAAARTLPGASRGVGSARARPGCASGRPGEFSGSQEAISGAIFDPRSTTFDPHWLFGELDKPRIQQS